MNTFEQYVRDSLEKYEVDSSISPEWEDLETRLNRVRPVSFSRVQKVSIGMVMGLLIIGAVYFISTHIEPPITPTDSINIAKTTHSSLPQHNNTLPEEEFLRMPTTDQSNIEESESSKREKAATEKQTAKISSLPLSTPNNVEHSTTSSSSAVVEKSAPLTFLQHEDKENVSQRDEERVPFHISSSLICEGQPVTFTAEETNGTYRWSFGDGETSSGRITEHVYHKAGTYTVKLRIISRQNKSPVEKEMKVVVYPAPNIDIQYSLDSYGMEVRFEAKGENVVNWKWNFGGNKISEEQNPIYSFTKVGTYPVEVVAKNSTGCTAVRRVNVEIDQVLLAPTGFTPDGDGLNDTWLPIALVSGNFPFTLTIYDKKGNMVFRTNNPNQPWDGRYQNSSKIAEEGESFVWKAVVNNKGREIIYEGFVIVLK